VHRPFRQCEHPAFSRAISPPEWLAGELPELAQKRSSRTGFISGWGDIALLEGLAVVNPEQP